MPVLPVTPKTSCDDCLGSCCYGWQIDVTEEEAARVGVENTDPNTIDDAFAKMRIDPATGACVMLDTDSGRCTIYEQRPQVCRDFELGGWSCFRKAVSRGWNPPQDPQ